MLLHLLGHRINKMQVYLRISTDANYFMLSLVSIVSPDCESLMDLQIQANARFLIMDTRLYHHEI